MELFHLLVIFCIILLIYLHILNVLKVNNDYEYNEIIEPSKVKLDEICNLKQPFIFTNTNPDIEKIINIDSLKQMHATNSVMLRDVVDRTSIYVPLQLKIIYELITKGGSYISENNNDFLKETGLIDKIITHDKFFHPKFTVKSEYDLIFGSNNAFTKLRYEISTNTFLYIAHGDVKIRLFVPKDVENFDIIMDYLNLEFRTDINPWTLNSETKFLDISLKQNQFIYIPTFWLYSILLNNEAYILVFKYNTIINYLTMFPKYILNLLQKQNIIYKIKEPKETKETHGIKEINETKEQVI